MMNKILFMGNLTRDPELKTLPSGVKVANFTIASTRKYNNSQGQLVEDTEFGNCILFSKQAETFAQYAVKGQTIMVEGRIKTRSWDDPSGKKMYRTEIMVERFIFLQKPKGASEGAPVQKPTGGLDDEWTDYPEEDINPEDIPF